MPLSFPSLSHGEIAFGFFNIESDLLLLNNYFFFADDFCRNISALAARQPDEQIQMDWDVYILDREDIGNLMGAINGVDLSGFIGETYRRFPFPQEPHLFRQNPEGDKTRSIFEAIIQKYANPSPISVNVDAPDQTTTIGAYRFSREVFQKLLQYVWVGGYPQWKDGVRPDYVLAMAENLRRSPLPLFGGATFH